MTTLQSIKITNTLTHKKEVFEPAKPGEVSVYGCGPTVYGPIHVGNARAFLTQDLLRRIFERAGYKVTFARNYTDVDDKIIKKANESGVTAAELAHKCVQIFDADMAALSVGVPQHRPKATETMTEIVAMIEDLKKKDLAYVAETPFGSDVYYRVDRFKDYGKLSKRKPDELLQGVRIEAGEAKENPLDFALWKAAKPDEPSWESPWGKGRPGWHIECSAMIDKIFPKGIDIHMGGLDLIFPHHENEIAQSEGAHAHPLARYWVHNGMLQMGQVKMSKSLGNIVTLGEFVGTYGPEVFRLMTYQQHYRSPMDFSEEAIVRTEALLERLYHGKLKAVASGSGGVVVGDLPAELKDLSAQIDESLYDDLNTAKALGTLLKAARFCFREEKPAYWHAWGAALPIFTEIFGILSSAPEAALKDMRARKLKRMNVTEERCQAIEARLKSREDLRAQKQFSAADDVRKALESEGINVMDGPDGSTWTVI